ncbi:hypothetical protein, partial [Frankia casuarinae]|uniref:hypothetical protein n=1 Tax=Frankia casuarinae (strain DSM 45818 / CECT 9043 / HFP020203 / CcI3) TaxID=106370 RepID=UPI001A9A29F9
MGGAVARPVRRRAGRGPLGGLAEQKMLEQRHLGPRLGELRQGHGQRAALLGDLDQQRRQPQPRGHRDVRHGHPPA